MLLPCEPLLGIWIALPCFPVTMYSPEKNKQNYFDKEKKHIMLLSQETNLRHLIDTVYASDSFIIEHNGSVGHSNAPSEC